MIDEISLAPPDDNHFQLLLGRAARGQIPVFGVVLDLTKVSLRRAFPNHRPELTRPGMEAVEAMKQGWQNGRVFQPWLYVRGTEYIVADDYHWIALVEKYQPDAAPAQCIGEPLDEGCLKRIGPLAVGDVRRMLGSQTVIKASPGPGSMS